MYNVRLDFGDTETHNIKVSGDIIYALHFVGHSFLTLVARLLLKTIKPGEHSMYNIKST